MAVPSTSQSNIADVTSTIERRLANSLPSTSAINADLSERSIKEQNDDLNKRFLTRGIFVLLTVGYYITTVMLILSGFQIGGFYLDPSVLVALVVSSMGGTAYMFRSILNTIL